MNFVDSATQADNRCIYMEVEKNSSYLITFKMDNRFRLGMTKDKFYKYNAVPNYYIDESDINGRVSANKYVHKTIQTGENNRLLIYYYTKNGSKDFIDIKKTFKIYKLENETL